MNHKFEKLSAIDLLISESITIKQALINELIDAATDDIVFMRRVRMLRQLSEYEHQIIKKIYRFDTDNVNDYKKAINQIIYESHVTTSRNA